MNVVLSFDSIKFPLTGIGRYIDELAKNRKVNSQIESLRLLSGHRLVSELPAPERSSQTGSKVLSGFKRSVIKCSVSVDCIV